MTIVTVEDLRLAAKRRVPRMFFDYVDSGAWTESTYRCNEIDFQRLKFRQRVGVDISNRSTAALMLGERFTIPVGLAPTGNTGMVHADGEILAAQAAEQFGVPYILSTMSICSIEDVAAHTTKPFWFQLYVMRDRTFVEALIDRAKAAKVSALMLTLDLQVAGQRNKDIRNGLTTPPKPTLRNLLDLATKPKWCFGMLNTPRRTFGNIVGHVKDIDNISSLSRWASQQFDPSFSWKDIEWIKARWGGKLILKGILDAEDASMAMDVGADALVVSNHGGRQLDSTISSIGALPAIVDAVGDRSEVWLDGGVRSGQDVLKALSLGAKGTLIGRPFLYGLGAFGQAGVIKCLEILTKELNVTMALCGCRSLRDISSDILINPNANQL